MYRMDTKTLLTKNKSEIISFNKKTKFNINSWNNWRNELISSNESNPFGISSLRYKLNDARQNNGKSLLFRLLIKCMI